VPEGPRRLSSLAGSVLLAVPLLAQNVPGPLPEEGRYVGRAVPDVAFRGARNATGSLLASGPGEPVLLALVFTRCAGVCSPFLASLARAQDSLGGGGRPYRTLVLSFDPRDTLGDMEEMAGRLGLRDRADWTFAAAEEDA